MDQKVSIRTLQANESCLALIQSRPGTILLLLLRIDPRSNSLPYRVLPAHIHPERLRDCHRAIRLQIVLQKGDQHAGRGHHRVVERVREVVALFLIAHTDAKPAGLRVAKVRTTPHLEILLLAGRPRLHVDALNF